MLSRAIFGRAYGMRLYSRYQKPFQNRQSTPYKTRPKQDPFAKLGGSDRDKEALGAIKNQVFKHSPRGDVYVISPDHPQGEMINFRDAIANVDLSESGFQFVGTRPVNNRFQCGIIKLVDRRKAMSAYSDYLHRQISNNTQIQASMRQQHNNSKDSESKSKTLKLTWEISVTDLVSHKWNQIEKILKKGTSLQIFLTTKSQARYISANDFTSESKVNQLTDLENLKRQKILDTLKTKLDEAAAKYSTSGNINDKLMIKIAGK